MTHTRIVGTISAMLALATALGARPADAQLTKAGVVVGLEGDARIQRLGAPSPAPLQFRDDVFVRDRATTGDNSLARFLLGGKAVLTMRERSVVTIIETPSSSTVDIASGRFALAVAKERLKPGEVIEIRTPNAVAGIRGTVVIAEVFQATAQAGGAAPGAFSTRFMVVRGVVDVTPIDQATGRPSGAAVTLNQNDAVTVTGSGVGVPQSQPTSQVQQLGATFTPTFQTTTSTLAALNEKEHVQRFKHLNGPRGKPERLRDVDPGNLDRGGDKRGKASEDRVLRPNTFGGPDVRRNPPGVDVPGSGAKDPGKGGGNGGGNGGGGGGGNAGAGAAAAAISVITNAITGGNPGQGHGHGHGHGP